MGCQQVMCEHCGNPVLKDTREINRSLKLGRKFFCNSSCAALSGNAPRRAKEIVMICPCGETFKTNTKKKASKHCSPSCASKYSVTEERREAQRQGGLEHQGNLLTQSEVLKAREAWKYAALRQYLAGRPHEFEFALGAYIYDLVLFDTQVIVEFDGAYHGYPDQMVVDADKDAVARAAGYTILRRATRSSVVIDPSTIEDL